MASAVEPLISLNAELQVAAQENNFPRILLLDTRRRELIKSLATNPDFNSDEYSLSVLEATAEQNQNMLNDLTEQMAQLTRVTSNKIKMIRGYRNAS
jgi:hypothetical protein